VRTGAAVGAGFGVLGEGDLDADEPEELVAQVERIISRVVIAGLDPAIHRLLKMDGCAGQARA